ncbi:sporulation membrane protein YtaF [Desulfofundulus thermobenzoicus]|uniref:Sporulation membrane protein YtaF n=1 Tax=Desulfofundulus thermobenzoicus TaxID=29376 RepID=A0A6N7ITB3_9FIRM|nr:manganese efflux pump [Desulfofundulus thermobenzoicus]MQL53324.1 sporulation membrane protein YtaF [Desulfofundulus thermobenzoicus]
MNLFSAFFLALSSNLDNIGIGASYGIRRIDLPFWSNLIVAIVTTIGTIISMCIGNVAANYISSHPAKIIGSSIIAGAGVWVILQSWIAPNKVESAPQVLKEMSSPFAPLKNEMLRAKTILALQIKSLGIIIQILKEPWVADMDLSRKIEGKEAFLLAFALMINNLASGFGGGMVGINIPLTAGMTFVLSLFTLAISVKFGHQYLSRWLGKYASLVAGIILIAVGIYEFFV